MSYLETYHKAECFGCEACVQVCGKNAITMEEDSEGFRYPRIRHDLCVRCGACRNVCPFDHHNEYSGKQTAFGGYIKDAAIRAESTSGGAFSAIVNAWCDENYVIFGAAAEGMNTFHGSIADRDELGRFRKSKYSQSVIGMTYEEVKRHLKQGRKVLFSGTPCQIAGLKAYLKETRQDKLLTVEVVCEGIPSPLFVRELDKYLNRRYGASIAKIDYRYKNACPADHPTWGKWDFQVMHILLQNGTELKRDRWMNPFWKIWLDHLMSRPSCYECPFAKTARGADITLGDLWGVHLYCPELYGRNMGSSLIVSNTEKGRTVLTLAEKDLYGHELDFSEALKYQSPLRSAIKPNEKRAEFLSDIKHTDYGDLCKKWAAKPTLRLLWQKYVWGNRQKVFIWNVHQQIKAATRKKEKVC